MIHFHVRLNWERKFWEIIANLPKNSEQIKRNTLEFWWICLDIVCTVFFPVEFVILLCWCAIARALFEASRMNDIVTFEYGKHRSHTLIEAKFHDAIFDSTANVIHSTQIYMQHTRARVIHSWQPIEYLIRLYLRISKQFYFCGWTVFVRSWKIDQLVALKWRLNGAKIFEATANLHFIYQLDISFAWHFQTLLCFILPFLSWQHNGLWQRKKTSLDWRLIK